MVMAIAMANADESFNGDFPRSSRCPVNSLNGFGKPFGCRQTNDVEFRMKHVCVQLQHLAMRYFSIHS